jgi:hypothetical protein
MAPNGRTADSFVPEMSKDIFPVAMGIKSRWLLNWTATARVISAPNRNIAEE